MFSVFQGILQKADALYSKGDFEHALVFYHRGNKLRPEVQSFRLGIQKSQEAIDNSIGGKANYKNAYVSPIRVKKVALVGRLFAFVLLL